uniref:Guanine nucleotide-binding protein subunit gamma n=1 Tax=Sinocyclocheilus anshuiensis TaxID=1608454 RepID=A0A671LF26_9TELE
MLQKISISNKCCSFELFINIYTKILTVFNIANNQKCLSSSKSVSKAAADLMAYCDAHIREDPLIVPVPASENPFREKKFFCTIL